MSDLPVTTLIEWLACDDTNWVTCLWWHKMSDVGREPLLQLLQFLHNSHLQLRLCRTTDYYRRIKYQVVAGKLQHIYKYHMWCYTLRSFAKKKNYKNPRLLWKWVGGSRSHSEFCVWKIFQNIAINQCQYFGVVYHVYSVYRYIYC